VVRATGAEQRMLTFDRMTGTQPPMRRNPPYAPPAKRQLGRTLVGVGLAAGVLAMAVWLGVALATVGDELLAGSPDQLGYVEVIVRQGDTLWGLAQRHGPKHRDIRETIDRIRRLNGLEARANLQPGERLMIPTR